jgi:hypothetical protein
MLIYKGGGYLVGVPARNLTEEEVKEYGKARLLNSGLYIEDTPKVSRKFKRSEAAEAVTEGHEND